MKKGSTKIDDSWVLKRAGNFSYSFSSFVSQFAPKIPEEKLEKLERLPEEIQERLEKASRDIDSKSMVKPDVPIWVKPFVSKIMQQVSQQASQQVSSELAAVADSLFGKGIFSLSDALHDVAKERGITNEGFLRLIKKLPEFEAFMYFLNVQKYYRDHCAHQLRTAVLGDFILDLKSDAGGMEGIIKDELELSSEEVRTAWWFTGLLHDTGIPLAKLCTAVNWSLLNEILRCYPSLDIEASPMFINLASDKLNNNEYLSLLADGMPKHWQELIKRGLGMHETVNDTVLFKAGYDKNQEYQPRNLKMDHGVVGAVNLLKTLRTPETLRRNLREDRPLIEAARAIAVHNFKDNLKDVPFEDFPLAFLLMLADELQEWGRPVPIPIKDTYFSTSLEKVALVDAISYAEDDDQWDIPYTNSHAKELVMFDFKRLCQDKNRSLNVLDCTEQFPESEILLTDVNLEKGRRNKEFCIPIRTKR
jgi:hypothetical protein